MLNNCASALFNLGENAKDQQEKNLPARKNMCNLWSSILMAQEMGKGLG
jgi:hypothetical protein